MQTELDRLRSSLEFLLSWLKTTRRLRNMYKKQEKQAKEQIKITRKRIKNASKEMRKKKVENRQGPVNI